MKDKNREVEKKKCFLWFHDWSKWSEPKDMAYTAVNWHTGQSYKGYAVVQLRRCLRCNKFKKQQYEI